MELLLFVQVDLLADYLEYGNSLHNFILLWMTEVYNNFLQSLKSNCCLDDNFYRQYVIRFYNLCPIFFCLLLKYACIQFVSITVCAIGFYIYIYG